MSTTAFATDGCPSEEELLAHLAGRSDQRARSRIPDHFDRCDECRQLIGPAVAALGSPLQQRPTPGHGDRTFADGQTVAGRYLIQRFIARGGMGEVYAALDLLLDDRVALKTLRSTVLDDDAATVRFKAEARLARRVTHANVGRILEFGVHLNPVPAGNDESESVPFLTMEYLEGETLASRIACSGPLPPDMATVVVAQVLDALEAIHAAGVVHRDLKSENVFLVRDGRGGERAVVMDFGLARSVDGSVISSWPHVGVLAGTIDCMSPEQIAGRPAGPSADIFALGVLMFEICCGRRPFVDIAPLKRLTTPAPRLPQVAPDVPPGWGETVARCMKIEPSERYASFDDIRAALSIPIANERRPAAASPPSRSHVLVAVALGSSLIGYAAAYTLGP